MTLRTPSAVVFNLRLSLLRIDCGCGSVGACACAASVDDDGVRVNLSECKSRPLLALLMQRSK